MRTRFLSVFLVLFSVASSLAAGELVLRWMSFGTISLPDFRGSHAYRTPDPYLGWRLIPDKDGWQTTLDYRVHVRTNSNGFRDAERSYQKKEGVRRIVVLGDSFIEGYQVSYPDMFSQQLQTQLGAGYEVLSMGVGGYGTAQEYLLFERDVLRYSPDIVLLGFFPVNDVVNNSRRLEEWLWLRPNIKTYGRPYGVLQGSELVFEPPDYERVQADVQRERIQGEVQNSIWSGLLVVRLIDRLAATVREPKVSPYDPNLVFGAVSGNFVQDYARASYSLHELEAEWEKAERVTTALLGRFQSLAKSKGIHFILFTVPGREQVDKGYQQAVLRQYPKLEFDGARLNRKLASFTGSQDIPFMDLLPEFERQYALGRTLFHQIEDRHWNSDGHALAAKVMTRFLKAYEAKTKYTAIFPY